MVTHTQIKISRRPEVLNRFGIGNTCLHDRIKKGLIPPSISLGSRSVGWLEHELNAVLVAMAANKGDHYIKKLIENMVTERYVKAKELIK
ncbi:helix-turn-helix transcriptional regulator [Oceanicoccus sagamiensis]|uniref:Uncharacterized protein n=1 Tax=Oceanicoccus sagamiensis TaxID=716816 RepID=A0A1X9N807_9GAMM|nr:hypothetical protein BST96_03775 [Oceanicoccus sagamiensis]